MQLHCKDKWGVCLSRCIWLCLCVQRSRQTYSSSRSVSPVGDSDSPVSSRPVKENWVIRHKWRQQRGIRQHRLEEPLPLHYHSYDKSGDCRKEKNTCKPITGLLHFVTEIRFRFCSFAQYWQCLWPMKIKSYLCLIFSNLAAYETEAAWESAHMFISCGNRDMLRFVCGCVHFRFPALASRPPAVCVWSHHIGLGFSQVEGSSVLHGRAQFVNGPKFLWCLKRTPAVLDRAESKSEGKRLSEEKYPKHKPLWYQSSLLNQFWDLAENVLSLRWMVFKQVRGDSRRPQAAVLFLQMYSLHNENIQVFQISERINQIWTIAYSWFGSQECRSLSQILQNIWIMEAKTNS